MFSDNPQRKQNSEHTQRIYGCRIVWRFCSEHVHSLRLYNYTNKWKVQSPKLATAYPVENHTRHIFYAQTIQRSAYKALSVPFGLEIYRSRLYARILLRKRGK